jgi:hypothetical protein
MKKKLYLEIEIDVCDLTPDERYEASQIECVDEKDIPRLKDIEASDLARIIEDVFPSFDMQWFEGSGTYARFKTAKVMRAAYRPTPGASGQHR